MTNTCRTCNRPIPTGLAHADFNIETATYHGEIQTPDWRDVLAVTVYVPFYGRYMVAKRDLANIAD